MALPENKIRRVKLPDGTVYEIIPSTLQDGSTSFKATLPELTEDSTVALEGKIIQKVADEQSIPDNELGLYRFTKTVEGVTQSSHIYEKIKEDHGAEETEFYKTTTTNGTQLNTGTFLGQFDSTLSNFVTGISTATNVYCFYYDNEYVSQNGIRIGTKNTGTLQLTLAEAGSITFGKYFSYNGSTHVVTYDTGSKVIVDGTDEYTFDTDTSTVTVELDAGQHTITSNGQDITGGSTQGRILLLSFEFEGEPYSIYRPKALARVEEVEAVNTTLNNHITASNNRFAEDERSIAANRTDINDINNRMGDIQIFQGTNWLPTPSADYLKKIIRSKRDNKLYQCVQAGEGVIKQFSFENVMGTSEITANNVSSFYGDVGNNFADFFEIYYEGSTVKLYRNNGNIKLGSSSAIGAVRFINTYREQPTTKLKFGVKAYNSNGSTIDYEVEIANEDESDYQYINGNLFLDDSSTEVIIDLSNDIPQGYYLTDIYINSVGQHNTGTSEDPVMVNNDKRLIITGIEVEYGNVEYQWVPVSCEDEIIVVDDPTEYTESTTKIYRKLEEDGSIKSAYINDKIVTPSTLVQAIADTSDYENGEIFDGDMQAIFENTFDIFGDNFSLDEDEFDYIVNYNQDGETTYGIRFGNDENYGDLKLVGCTPNKVIRVIVGKYFEYNGQGEKVFDEHCAFYCGQVVGDEENRVREIAEEKQVFEVKTDDNGNLYFDSDGDELGFGDTRFILYGFEVGEPERTEVVQTNLEIEIVDLTQLN